MSTPELDTTLPGEPRSRLAGVARERELLERVGEFELERRLGAGTMGAVWRARDTRLGRPVAIKLLRPRRRPSARARERMLREARAMARVVHPNVVAIHEIGRIPVSAGEIEPVYIVLEYVEGTTLREWRPPGGGWRATVELFEGAARGLAAAHDAGLIHRDFKPENVLIEASTGRAKVADFGLVQVDDAGSEDGEGWDDESAARSQRARLQLDAPAVMRTNVGAIVGTPAYMAPEQLMGLPVTAACDQFAFCLCLLETLRGAHPWRASTLQELKTAAAKGRLVPELSEFSDPGLPRWLVRALRQGLAREPGDRFSDMHALLDALERGPRRVRAWTGAAILTVTLGATAGTSAWLAKSIEPGPQTPDAPACQASLEHLHATWDAERRGALEGTFVAAAGEPGRKGARYLGAFIDDRVGGVRAELEGLCGVADARPLSPREQLILACLDERVAKLEVTLEVLDDPSAPALEGALDVAGSNLDLGECADSNSLALLPKEPARRARHVELSAALARLRAREVLVGGLDEAQYDAIQAEVEAFGGGSLTADFWTTKGRYWMWRGAHDKQEQAFRRAFLASASAGDEVLALESLGGLLHSLSSQGRFDEAAWIRDMGDVQRARSGTGDSQEVINWLAYRGADHYIQRDFEAAAEDFGAAAELSRDRAHAYLDYATLEAGARRASGDFERAAALYETIVAGERETFGLRPGAGFRIYYGYSAVFTDRDTTRSLELIEAALNYTDGTTPFNEAGVYRERVGMRVSAGAYAEALEAAEAGRAFFAEHPEFLDRQVVLEEYAAEALIGLGRLDDAEVSLDRIAAHAYGEELTIGDRGRTRSTLLRAIIALERGQVDAAEELLASEGVDSISSFAARLSHHGLLELTRARVDHARGDLEGTLAHLRSGLEVLDGQLTVNAHCVRSELELLRAEVAWAQAGEDATARARARAWAFAARDRLSKADTTEGRRELLGRAQAWLEAHP